MYKRNAQGWSKHLDFILLDAVSLIVAFILAAYIRMHSWAFVNPIYRVMALNLVVVDFAIAALNGSMHDVIKRGYLIEAYETFKHCFYIFSIATVYMFATKSGVEYSRIVLFLTFILHILIGYGSRILWKRYIKKHGASKKKTAICLLLRLRTERKK